MGLTRKSLQELEVSGKTGKEGTTFVAVGASGKEYAVKLFKPKKSVARLKREAEFLRVAAERGVAPRMLGVNTEAKFIVMEKLKETIVARMRGQEQLTDQQQRRIVEIFETLDDARVLHNDGNPLNLMVDNSDRIMVIDFGMAKTIDKKMLKKRGPHPNVDLTLWQVRRELKKYGLGTPLLRKRYEQYQRQK
tara:strand:+ start:147 stop:722 length:576 start_codon:yes stop_codon:yes gene_type:complete